MPRLSLLILATLCLAVHAFSSAAPKPPRCGHQGGPRPAGCLQTTEEAFKLPHFELDAGLPDKHIQFTPLITGLAAWETPMAARVFYLQHVLMWNCIPAYHPTFLEHIPGRPPARPTLYDDNAAHHTTDARSLCAAYAIAAAVPSLIPAYLPTVMEYTAFRVLRLQESDFGLPPELDLDTGSCHAEDGACRRRYLECHGHAPRAMGELVAQAVLYAVRRDGYNMMGEVGFGGKPCTANCRPYQNAVSYNPLDTAGHACETGDGGGDACWKPLLEDDGLGFFYRQEHVTPHIGSQALLFSMSREEADAREVASPAYDYAAEARLVADRLSELTDELKMEIEFFDFKSGVASTIQTSFFVALIQQGMRNSATWEFLRLVSLGLLASEYDTAVLSWKEKIRHNLVRPTTYIQERLTDDDMVTYAGPGRGTRTIKGRDFQAYIRVMPHAEYPSASACICEGIDDFITAMSAKYLDLGPFPLSATRPAGSSGVEPGLTPAEGLTLRWDNISHFRHRCGQTRLDGGMHFPASVSAGYELCDGVGDLVFEKMLGLVGGEPIPEETSTPPACEA